jgi:uncharacterized membrane protein
MNKVEANFLSYLFIVATVATAAWLYPGLPDPMPSHWNIDGEVDGWMPKFWGVVVLPGSAILIFVIFRLIPRMSPKGFRTERFSGVLNVLQVAMVAFMCFVSFLVLLTAKGIDVHMNQMIFGGMGVLFIVVGLSLGKVRKNFFVGVRTPWTLASDEVWARTHRVAGWAFVAMGSFFLAGVFVRIDVGWLVTVIVVLALVPVVYSYFLYRRVEGFDEDADA